MLRRSAVRHPSVLKREVQLVRFDGESHQLTRSGNPAYRGHPVRDHPGVWLKRISTPSPLAHAKLAFASDLRNPNGI